MSTAEIAIDAFPQSLAETRGKRNVHERLDGAFAAVAEGHESRVLKTQREAYHQALRNGRTTPEFESARAAYAAAFSQYKDVLYKEKGADAAAAFSKREFERAGHATLVRYAGVVGGVLAGSAAYAKYVVLGGGVRAAAAVATGFGTSHVLKKGFDIKLRGKSIVKWNGIGSVDANTEAAYRAAETASRENGQSYDAFVAENADLIAQRKRSQWKRFAARWGAGLGVSLGSSVALEGSIAQHAGSGASWLTEKIAHFFGVSDQTAQAIANGNGDYWQLIHKFSEFVNKGLHAAPRIFQELFGITPAEARGFGGGGHGGGHGGNGSFGGGRGGHFGGGNGNWGGGDHGGRWGAGAGAGGDHRGGHANGDSGFFGRGSRGGNTGGGSWTGGHSGRGGWSRGGSYTGGTGHGWNTDGWRGGHGGNGGTGGRGGSHGGSGRWNSGGTGANIDGWHGGGHGHSGSGSGSSGSGSGPYPSGWDGTPVNHGGQSGTPFKGCGDSCTVHTPHVDHYRHEWRPRARVDHFRYRDHYGNFREWNGDCIFPDNYDTHTNIAIAQIEIVNNQQVLVVAGSEPYVPEPPQDVPPPVDTCPPDKTVETTTPVTVNTVEKTLHELGTHPFANTRAEAFDAAHIERLIDQYRAAGRSEAFLKAFKQSLIDEGRLTSWTGTTIDPNTKFELMANVYGADHHTLAHGVQMHLTSNQPYTAEQWSFRYTETDGSLHQVEVTRPDKLAEGHGCNNFSVNESIVSVQSVPAECVPGRSDSAPISGGDSNARILELSRHMAQVAPEHDWILTLRAINDPTYADIQDKGVSWYPDADQNMLQLILENPQIFNRGDMPVSQILQQSFNF